MRIKKAEMSAAELERILRSHGANEDEIRAVLTDYRRVKSTM
jgi:SOS response regulatory protein OraA/RecX